MNCAQNGCEITADALAEAGSIPLDCPTCGHPLRLVLTVDEAGEMMGLPVEEAPEGESEETPQE